jgi:hypothetical protein
MGPPIAPSRFTMRARGLRVARAVTLADRAAARLTRVDRGDENVGGSEVENTSVRFARLPSFAVTNTGW